ncbi:MAG: molybdenum cofactor guanylyltransferase [Pseudomonadota bacterium]
MSGVPLKGLVLCGGASRRMGQDKALLSLDGVTLLDRAAGVLGEVCDEVWVSGARDRESTWPCIVDVQPGLGPMGGLFSAQRFDPEAAWFLLAVDMPAVQRSTLTRLIDARDGTCEAVAYRRETNGGELLEPCCALYEPGSAPKVAERVASGDLSLTDLLVSLRVKRLATNPAELVNVNTPETWAAFQSGGGPHSA